jgi:hypothetical protein
MTAPIPNSHRIDYFDHDGWVYDTVWGMGQPPEANAVGNVVPVNNTEPGQSPLGDCTRTTVYDDRGEPIHTAWNPCQPAQWLPADPDFWYHTPRPFAFGSTMELAG